MRPLSLRLKNVYSHEDSFINFRSKKLSLIIGEIDGDEGRSNTAGKSSIFSGLEFCLFGTTRSGTNKIIRDGQKECEATLIFRGDDKVDYRVTRHLKLQNNGSVTSELGFYFLDKGTWARKENDTKKSRIGIQSEINKVVGMDAEVFKHSIRLQQQDIGALALAQPADRRKVFKRFIDMNRWDGLESVAKARKNSLKEDLDRETNLVEELSGRVENSEALAQRLKEIEVEIVNQNSEKKEKLGIFEEIQLRLSKISEIAKLKERCDSLEKDIAASRSSIEQFTRSANSIREGYSKEASAFKTALLVEPEHKRRSEEISVELRSAPHYEKFLLESSANIKKLNEEKNKAEQAYAVAQSQISSLKESKKKLLSLEGKCPTCWSEVSAEHVASIVDVLRIQYNTAKLQSDSHKKTAESFSLEIENELSREKEYSQKVNSVAKLKLEQDALTAILKEFADKRVLFVAKRKEVQGQIDLYTKNREETEKNLARLIQDFGAAKKEYDVAIVDSQNAGSVQAEATRITAEISDIDKSISFSQKNYGEFQNRFNTSVKLSAEISAKKILIDQLSKKLNVAKQVEKSLGKQGIQAIILENSLNYFESTARSYLKRFTNGVYDIKLETTVSNKDNDNLREVLNIVIDKGNGIWHPYESFSGSETMKVDLAMRVGLSLLAASFSSVKPEYLFIDEVAGSLDAQGRRLFMEMLVELSKDFEMILVVTHFPELQDEFKDFILVKKTGYISTIIDNDGPTGVDLLPIGELGVSADTSLSKKNPGKTGKLDNTFYLSEEEDHVRQQIS